MLIWKRAQAQAAQAIAENTNKERFYAAVKEEAFH
jgi:hypothetical protein